MKAKEIYAPWSEGVEQKPVLSQEETSKLVENLAKLIEKRQLPRNSQ
jgi:DNA-directed RNA polymerase subunit H (RpoH/RPB5)